MVDWQAAWHRMLARLPQRVAYPLATRMAYFRDDARPTARARVSAAIARALPELGEAAADRAAASLPRMWEREIQDAYRLSRLNRARMNRLIRLHGIERFHAARRDGRPLILYSAHFNRLILPAIALALNEKLAIHSLVADIDNPALPAGERRYLAMKLREMGRLLGGEVIARGRGTRALYRVLHAGGVLVVIVDAPAAAGDRPIQIPFLNGHGRFSPGILKLARRYNARLLPYFAVERDGALHGEIGASVKIDGCDEEQALRAILAPVEAMIRAHPEQWWMWPHLDAIWTPVGAETD